MQDVVLLEGSDSKILTELKINLRGGPAAVRCPFWLGQEVMGAKFSDELLHTMCLVVVCTVFLEIRPQVPSL